MSGDFTREKNSLSCFVSAASDGDARVLIEAVMAAKLVAFARQTSPLAFAVSARSVVGQIRNADFVIAVPSNDADKNAAVIWELGIAAAFDKPILNISMRDAAALPLDSANYFATVESISADAIAPYIRAFAQLVTEENVAPVARAQPREPTAAEVEEYAQQLNSEQEIVREISFALSSTHLQHKAATKAARDLGLDLLVWLPDLTNDIGNPVGIEVKARPRVEFPARLTSEFTSLLAKHRLRSLILSSPKLTGEFCWVTPVGYVFGVRPTNLVSAIKNRELSNLLLWLRDRASRGLT